MIFTEYFPMCRTSQYRLFLVFLGLCSLTLAGCGGAKGVTPKGQVVQNGSPYKLAPGEEMTVSFTPTSGKGKNTSDKVNEDGTFTITGIDGKGLPPGNYKILVNSTMTGDNVPADQQYKDRFENAFSLENTPLQMDIAEGPPLTLEIDVVKKTVAKK